MNKMINVLSTLLALLLFSPVANAGDAQDQTGRTSPPPPENGTQTSQGRPEKMSIPQFAIDACVGKSPGAACKAGKGTGVCEYTPDKKFFACKPDFKERPEMDHTLR